MKRFFTPPIVILLIMASMKFVSAQEIEENAIVRDCLDQIFTNIDKTKVPTGLLRDYAFTLVDFDQYDGMVLTDSNYVDKATFEYILRSVRSSAVLQKPFEPVSSIINEMHEESSSSMVCGIALYKYNYVKPNALEDGLIRYENDRVYDTYDDCGNWLNPYDEKYIIGFTSYTTVRKSGIVNFTFPEKFVFTNTEISKMELDAGNGYQVVIPGGTMSAPISSDKQELKLKVTLEDGRVLICHSMMYSYDKYIAVKSSNDEPVRSPDMTEVFNLGQEMATASIFYASNNSRRQILKPFIVVEGFDPVELSDYLLKSGQRKNSNPFYDKYGFTNAGDIFLDDDFDVLVEKYDVIYIDWENSEADIRKNADLLISIIKWINNEKLLNGSTESNALMGQSMGGLVARYALRKMEINGQKHGVTTFVSHDVPYLGANIPLGMLYGAHSILSFLCGGVKGIDLSSKVDGLDTGIKILKKYLYSDSAKQMLLNFVNEYGQLDNTAHVAWQDELNVYGFPVGDNGKGILNLAVTNGGVWDYSSIDYYAHASGYLNSNLLNFLFVFSPIGVITGFNPHIPITIDVLPYFSHGTMLFNMNVEFRTQILFFIPLRINIFKSSYYAPGGGLMYETYPGSTYSIRSISDDSGRLGIINYDYQIDLAERFTFIPNASALCIGNGEKKLSENDFVRKYWYNPPKPIVETPFHAIFSKEDASGHIHAITGMCDWVLQQMEIKVNGPSMPVSGDQYTLDNCPYQVTWSTGDSNVATIDRYSGEITVNNPGVTTVNAQYDYNAVTISRSKTIMVGLPDFYLQMNKNDLTYSVIAKCRTDNKAFKLFFDEGLISYEWGMKKGSEPIKWTTQKDSVFVIGAASTNQPFTVYMRARCSNGMKGPVYSIVVQTPYSFTYTPKFIVSNKNGELFICTNYGIGSIGSEAQPIVLNIKRSKVLDQQGVNPGMVHRIVINGEKVRYWYEYPGGVDASTGSSFYMLYENEFIEYKSKLKPWGDTDTFIFSVRAQDSAQKDMQISPVVMMYIEDFPQDYNEAIMMDMYFNDFVK